MFYEIIYPITVSRTMARPHLRICTFEKTSAPNEKMEAAKWRVFHRHKESDRFSNRFVVRIQLFSGSTIATLLKF